jgi:hypothetical protein
MKTRNNPLLFTTLLILALILAACGAGETPYAEAIQPVLDGYTTFNEGTFATYQQLLSIGSNMDTSITYGDLLMGTIASYMNGQGVPAQGSWDPADLAIFIGQVQMVYDEAQPLLASLEALTPTAEAAEAHAVLRTCLQYRVDIAEVTLNLMQNGTYAQLNYMTDPCEGADAALATLSALGE